MNPLSDDYRPRYAELHTLSNFTFLRGASHAEELVNQAVALGYEAIAITDECSLAGVVKAYNAARNQPIKLIIGSQFTTTENLHLVALATDKAAYSELSQLITLGRRRCGKGQYQISLSDCTALRYCLFIWLPKDGSQEYGELLAQQLAHRLWIGVNLHHQAHSQQYYLARYELALRYGIPLVAVGDIHMHERPRKILQDVLTAIRHNTSVSDLGTRLQPNGELYLRRIDYLEKLYPRALLDETLHIAEQCHFCLSELHYQYPDEVVPPGKNASEFLRELSYSGAIKRWPEDIPSKVKKQLDHELQLIEELRYEHYFLTVYDIVQFARNAGILCQGRGSAANSAVCYCLFITEVDPARSELLFERFISKERDEPPDIDVDFEHQRREEVIQYIYRKYGRERAALAATVITYRHRSAVRDVGKALGFDQDLIDNLSKSLAWWDKSDQLQRHLQTFGVQQNSAIAQLFLQLVNTLLGFPRHLSQHVGGFIIAREAIANLVPVENAAMAERTIIQWDKEDLESLKLLKIDVLALGMLSAIRRSLHYISQRLGQPFQLSDIPAKDPDTYAMLSRADSIGVFQVESRAQMTMLPRLKPRSFYDLVIQIAIIRPGPIQGGMVHPFLRRRQGLEQATYANPEIEKVLKRTLGVPIFQEQVIKLAMVAAGFSGGEADQLRRAMASWGRNGRLLQFRDKLVNGMLKNGYSETFAEQLFSQMKGFGAYGFPESHSASFALLAYASAWLKRHYPAEFFCGLLNSQPMGFYSPSQLIQDASRHNINVRSVSVQHSSWEHRVDTENNRAILQLGFCLIKGFKQTAAERIVQARQQTPFTGIADVMHRCALNRQERNCLVRADAFTCFDSHRYQSQWQISAAVTRPDDLAIAESDLNDGVALPGPDEARNIVADYQYTGLSLRRHPMALLRNQPRFRHCQRAADLLTINEGRFIRIAGLVTCRQRPGTASGVLFITLEDETGNSNIVVWKNVQERYRQQILRGTLLLVKGKLQRTGHIEAGETPVIHIVAMAIEDASEEMALRVESHDFH